MVVPFPMAMVMTVGVTTAAAFACQHNLHDAPIALTAIHSLLHTTLLGLFETKPGSFDQTFHQILPRIILIIRGGISFIDTQVSYVRLSVKHYRH